MALCSKSYIIISNIPLSKYGTQRHHDVSCPFTITQVFFSTGVVDIMIMEWKCNLIRHFLNSYLYIEFSPQDKNFAIIYYVYWLRMHDWLTDTIIELLEHNSAKNCVLSWLNWKENNFLLAVDNLQIFPSHSINPALPASSL